MPRHKHSIKTKHVHWTSDPTPKRITLPSPIIHNVPPNISEHATIHISDSLTAALSTKTLAGYTSTVYNFLSWCESEHIPSKLRFPAHESVLCAYAARRIGLFSGKTARADITALRAWHLLNGLPWNFSSRVHYILKGVDRLAPAHSRRPPRPPFSLHMLTDICSAVNPQSHFDTAVLAAATLAFWGLCRS
jgi:hypothetical protein